MPDNAMLATQKMGGPDMVTKGHDFENLNRVSLLETKCHGLSFLASVVRCTRIVNVQSSS